MYSQTVMVPVLDVEAGCHIYDPASSLTGHSFDCRVLVSSVFRPTIAVVALQVRAVVDSEVVHASMLYGHDDLVAIGVDDLGRLGASPVVGYQPNGARRRQRTLNIVRAIPSSQRGDGVR